jgi:hypothetical protein
MRVRITTRWKIEVRRRFSKWIAIPGGLHVQQSIGDALMPREITRAIWLTGSRCATRIWIIAGRPRTRHTGSSLTAFTSFLRKR